MYRQIIYLLIIAAIISPLSYSQTQYVQEPINWQALDWQKKKHKKAITISVAKINGASYPAVKTEMQIKTSLSELVALIMDADKCTQWVERCHLSRVNKKISSTEYYQYFISKPPWPLKKRDFLVHVIITQDENLNVHIKAQAKNNVYPEQANIIRITKTQSLWEFIPSHDGTVKVVNYAYVEPVKKVPRWLGRRVLISTPYKTLYNMRKVIEQSTETSPRLHFIKEKNFNTTIITQPSDSK